MKTFALLWSTLLDSSLWVNESKETRLVWVALMAMKDSAGVVHASEVGLAHRSRVTIEECREALRVLSSPDPFDTSGVDEGRRIREVEGGWQVVNHDKYRFSTPAKREYWREQKRRQRSAKPGKQLPGEAAAVRSINNGDDKGADAITTEALPLAQSAREQLKEVIANVQTQLRAEQAERLKADYERFTASTPPDSEEEELII